MDTIRKTMAVASKELRVFSKDRGYLFSMFIIPLLVSIIVASANAASGSGVPILPVVLVNHDAGEHSELILEILYDIEDIEITALDSDEEANQLVGNGDMLAAVIIPVDFSERVDAYEQATVQVVIDPAQAEYSTIITTIMEEVTEPVAIQGEINYGMQSVLDDMGLEGEEKQASEAQQEGVVNTQMREMRDDPRIAVRKVDLEGAEVVAPENLFTIFMPGFTVMFAFFLMPALATELLREKHGGSLRRLMAAPIHRGSIISGKMLAYMLMVLLQVALIFGIGNIAFNMPLGSSPLGLLLVTLALGLAATALGMMIAALVPTKAQAESLGVLLIFILGGLGGCFPFGLEPLFRQGGVMGFVSNLTPHAHALEGYWLLMNEGAGVVDVLPQIAILVGMAAIFFVIAVWRFRFD